MKIILSERMLLRLFNTFLIISLTIYNIVAQENITLKATVKDLDNGTSLSYCSVRLKKIPIGIITNEEGAFELNLKATYLNDTLLISCIGYDTYKQTVANLIANNMIFLKRSIYSLQEVFISPELTAENILKNVYQYYRANYSDSIVQLTGFFRTYFKTDNIYDKLVEGDISMRTKGFNKKKNVWNKYNIYLNEIRGSLNSGKIKDGKDANSLNEMVIIYENYLNQLQRDKLFNTKIQIDKVEYEGETKIYDLVFHARNEEKFSETNISLKINSTNWAIEELKYNSKLYEKNKAQILKSNIDSIRFRNVSDNFLIRYTNIHGKYYLNFFQREYKKEIFSPTSNYGFNINTEYVTTHINESLKESLGIKLIRSTSLYEQVCKIPYHQKFWEHYNLLLENSELIKIKKDLEQNGNIDEQFNNTNKYPTDSKKGKK